MMGEIIRQTAELTADRQCIGAGKLVVFANAVEDNPFMAGAFHGVGEADCVLNVGVSGPGVVHSAIQRAGTECSMNEIADIIKKTAFKITRMGQLVGSIASERLNVPFGIVDLSLAPTPAVGDSVARILEEVGLECLRHPRHHSHFGYAQRRCQKGRRDGIRRCRRSVRCIYSGI